MPTTSPAGPVSAGHRSRAPSPRSWCGLGDPVADGDALVVLEAMKMEHTLRAGGGGTVGQVRCAAGDQVDVGDLLVTVVPQ